MSSRRGHGEGAISRRKDGRWVARIDLGYINGKRKVKAIYAKTRKEAAEKLRQEQQRNADGINIAPARQTVTQFLERWLTDVVAPTKRTSTHARYELAVRQHITPHIGQIQLAKLTAEQVQAMLTILSLQGLRPATVHNTFRVLRTALNVAVRWQLIPRNIVTLVDPPRIDAYHATILTPDAAQRLLRAARGERLEALYLLTLSLGLRRGEVLGLRWQDVDLEAGTVRIVQMLQELNGVLAFAPLKTDRSRRTLPLAPSLVAALREHQARQLDERLGLGAAWREHGLVFPSDVGTPMSPSNMWRSFQRLLRRAGLPPMRFHDLRHSCGTFLALQGVPMRTAMEIMGHSTITTTAQIYMQVLDTSKRDAAAQMEALLAPVEELT